jgi:signal transduction histidine kinase
VNAGPLQQVRRASIRVALAATTVVAVAYLAVAVAVVVLVTRNLTAQIDGNLANALAQITRGNVGPPPGGGGFAAPPPKVPFGAPVIVWTRQPNGTVMGSRSDAMLPAAYSTVGGPVTIQIGNASVRIEGAPAGDRYVVVGQSTEAVSQAQGTVIVAEIVIGLVLLLVTFLGAVTIGRRVAAPIELARHRQLEFTADASHELRTPLSVIEANTSLALAEKASSGKDDRKWYAIMASRH